MDGRRDPHSPVDGLSACAGSSMSEAHVVQGGMDGRRRPQRGSGAAAQWLTGRHRPSVRAAVPFGRQGSLGGSAAQRSAAAASCGGQLYYRTVERVGVHRQERRDRVAKQRLRA
jgi:hypothetical protein